MPEDINKTKLLLARCLCKRLKTEYLDQIKVSDLCRDAGISRTTFYMYFKDVFSIPEWYWNYGCRAIMNRIGQEYGGPKATGGSVPTFRAISSSDLL